MGWFTTTVEVDDQSITLNRGFRSQTMRWQDVMRVYAEKIDKLTYEELFIILEDNARNAVSVGELDEAFSQFEAELQIKLKQFPSGWRVSSESRATGHREQIWCRNLSP